MCETELPLGFCPKKIAGADGYRLSHEYTRVAYLHIHTHAGNWHN